MHLSVVSIVLWSCLPPIISSHGHEDTGLAHSGSRFVALRPLSTERIIKLLVLTTDSPKPVRVTVTDTDSSDSRKSTVIVEKNSPAGRTISLRPHTQVDRSSVDVVATDGNISVNVVEIDSVTHITTNVGQLLPIGTISEAEEYVFVGPDVAGGRDTLDIASVPGVAAQVTIEVPYDITFSAWDLPSFVKRMTFDLPDSMVVRIVRPRGASLRGFKVWSSAPIAVFVSYQFPRRRDSAFHQLPSVSRLSDTYRFVAPNVLSVFPSAIYGNATDDDVDDDVDDVSFESYDNFSIGVVNGHSDVALALSYQGERLDRWVLPVIDEESRVYHIFHPLSISPSYTYVTYVGIVAHSKITITVNEEPQVLQWTLSETNNGEKIYVAMFEILGEPLRIDVTPIAVYHIESDAFFSMNSYFSIRPTPTTEAPTTGEVPTTEKTTTEPPSSAISGSGDLPSMRPTVRPPGCPSSILQCNDADMSLFTQKLGDWFLVQSLQSSMSSSEISSALKKQSLEPNSKVLTWLFARYDVSPSDDLLSLNEIDRFVQFLRRQNCACHFFSDYGCFKNPAGVEKDVLGMCLYKNRFP